MGAWVFGIVDELYIQLSELLGSIPTTHLLSTGLILEVIVYVFSLWIMIIRKLEAFHTAFPIF